ncbi:MAG: ATP synthase F1 subunit gamma [Erysipelotrichaceae bacterium]
MAGGKLAIKSRIRSVDSTKKITKAMQLVAASKLTKIKSKMLENREYASYLKDIVQEILSNIETSDHPYLVQTKDKPKLYVVFTSDMGLCGGYNANVYRLLETTIKPSDKVIMLGSRGTSWIKTKNYDVIDNFNDIEEGDYDIIVQVANKALELYTNKEIAGINIVYTSYVNPMVFNAEVVELLPVKKDSEIDKVEEPDGKLKFSGSDTIFEPAGDTILDELVPMYLKSLLYSYLLETKTSESASRRTAMESATDNAEELKEALEFKFNQARQAAITQEISEIVAGANAL